MGVAKSKDGGIRIMIARASVPRIEPSIGTELNHPERNSRAGIRMTVTIGADERQRQFNRIAAWRMSKLPEDLHCARTMGGTESGIDAGV